MATREDLERKIDKLEVNMDRTDRIVNGTEAEDVLVDGGVLVPSVRKWQKELEEEYGIPSEILERTEDAASRAEGAANAAQAAAGAAFINADVYPDVATGLAAVADGEQFQVLSDDGMEYIRYRKDSASAQTEVGRYTTPAAVVMAADAVSVQYQQPNLFSLQQLNFEIVPTGGVGTAIREIVNGVVALRLDTNESGVMSQTWRFPSSEFPSGLLSASVVIESMEAGSASAFNITFRDAGFNSLGGASLSMGTDEIVNPTVFRHAGLAVPAGAAYADFNVTANKTEGDMRRRTYMRSMLLADGKNSSFRQPPLDEPPVFNYFPVPELSSDLATLYQAERIIEDGESVLRLSGSSIQQVHYEFPATGIFSPGNTLTVSAEAWADVAPGASGSTADVNILCLNSSGGTIGALPATQDVSGAETYTKQEISRVVPDGTVTIRIRFVKRATAPNIAQEAKFRRVVLTSSSPLTKVINVGGSPEQAVEPAVSSIFWVDGESGSDSNGGQKLSPVKTISRAVSLAGGSDATIYVSGGEYRETLDLNNYAGSISIIADSFERVIILGSERLVVSKTDGMSQVYQAPLTAKPQQGTGRRSPGRIFDFDTPSFAVPNNERHPLQRGEFHRLPFTALLEATSKAELDTPEGLGKWFWESGTIYFAAVDGGDATLGRYEASVRPCILGNNAGKITLSRVDAYFSSSHGMSFTGTRYVDRNECRSMGSHISGYYEGAQMTRSVRDEAGGNGNDGFNGHAPAGWAGTGNREATYSVLYFDPWGHDNFDDGHSIHERGEGSVFGGLFEHNVKAGVVHISGSAVTCYHTISRGATMGFATGGVDANRNGEALYCFGTESYDNDYNYRSYGDKSLLVASKCISGEANEYGYEAATGEVIAKNCMHSGSAGKSKQGNVTVITDSLLT